MNLRRQNFATIVLDDYSQIAVTQVDEYLILKRSLQSVVRISLYHQFQAPAESERIYRSSLNCLGDSSLITISIFCEK